MRECGILLPVASLPSKYGIGGFSREAYEFIDQLKRAGQNYWQILPLGPTGYGDSPYQSLGACAGNHYLIDLDRLADEGLLKKEEIQNIPWGSNPARVDFGAMYAHRMNVLRQAFQRFTPDGAYETFVEQNRSWLEDYALFTALKDTLGGKPWLEWPEALRLRKADALAEKRRELSDEIRLQYFVQYEFDRQWKALRSYANAKGVRIIGDVPIYVPLDSADVWSERKEFLLDGRGMPGKVAGVPPDYFCADGQLWGNPLYDWKAMKADGFGWWIRRVEGATRLFDAIRLDHFRAFASYWAVPAGAKTAREGAWEQGPGMDLLGVLTSWFPQITYIAEDLGILTEDVHRLRKDSGLPGMKVLEFAFSGPDNAYLPHQYPDSRCICYTGTHDNDTAAGWYASATPQEKAYARKYLGVERDDAQTVCRALLRAGQGSIAELFVAQMQDYLGLGSEARVNVPGVPRGNWSWRMEPGKTTDALADAIRDLTHTFGRC